MAFFNWSRWLRSVSERKVKTYRRRKPRSIRPNIETLEERTVFSTLPAPLVSNQQTLTTAFGNPIANHPLIDAQVAIDPTDSNDVVASASYNPTAPSNVDLAGLRIWSSTDGGKTWSAPLVVDNIVDPTSFAVTQGVYVNNEHDSLAFDSFHHFYIVSSEHNASNSDGAFVLSKFNFPVGGAVSKASLASGTNSAYISAGSYLLYRWGSGNDPAYHPVVAIDNNQASYTDPITGLTQTDNLAAPNAGFAAAPRTIYVAWNTNFTQVTNSNPATDSRILVSASDDGGLDFTTPEYVSGFATPTGYTANTTPGTEPQIGFTQGTFNNGGTGVGGKLVFVWNSLDNFNDNKFNQISIDTSTPASASGHPGDPVGAKVFSSGIVRKTIVDATVPGTTPPNNTPVTTISAPIPVDLTTDPNFGLLADLSVSVNILANNLNELSVTLNTPGGSFLLFTNGLNPNNGNAFNPNHGASGTTMGLYSNGATPPVVHDVGTVFDMQAPRQIFDGTASAPYIGYFQPAAGWGALLGLSAAALSSPTLWTLSITDNINNGGPPPPTAFLDSWSLTFASHISTSGFGQAAGLDITLPTQYVSPAPASVPATTVNGSVTYLYPNLPAPSVSTAGVGVGPGISLAIDNTLGSYSQFQGTIYVAYTGFASKAAAATNNTDVYILSSSNGGSTWQGGVNDAKLIPAQQKVSDDTSADGFSEGNRAQYMPNVAVDQATGTVVMTWYDARQDAAQIRLANYIATSIDGGTTWADPTPGTQTQTFVNQPKQAIDGISGATVTLEAVPGNQPVAGTSGLRRPARPGSFQWPRHSGVRQQPEHRRLVHHGGHGHDCRRPAHHVGRHGARHRALFLQRRHVQQRLCSRRHRGAERLCRGFRSTHRSLDF